MQRTHRIIGNLRNDVKGLKATFISNDQLLPLDSAPVDR